MKILHKPVSILFSLAFLAVLVLILRSLTLVNNSANTSNETDSIQPKNVKIIVTNPDPLDGATILQNQSIEITFEKPLENLPELKIRIEPQIPYNIELTQNKKTVVISPKSVWQLGMGYSLFILQDTKFEGKETLDKEVIYHFQTIKYKGV